MTTPSSLERDIRLRDGRRLAYAEYGDTQGKPVFLFHGTPGSRLFHHPDTSVAASCGARIIAVDRPGFGRSDFKPGRTLLDWPSDVVQLADALSMERFAVVGYSGGGPYAAVCASSIPDRLTATGLVSSLAPLDNPQMTRGMHGLGHMFFSVDRHVPPLARAGCWLICTTWRYNPDLYFRAQVNGLCRSQDPQILLKMKEMMKADFLEAIRSGTQGITWDLELLTQSWGFHLHTIPTDVLLWHGESDTQAPLVMGRRLASAIPHCRATFFPGEGHWIIYNHWQEILTALVQSEAVVHEEPQSVAIAVARLDSSPNSEIVLLPECPEIAIVDMPADSSQGLQPVRQVADKPTERSETTLADMPAGVSLEPEKTPDALKPVSRKTAKRRIAARAEIVAGVSPEPEPAPETPKPAVKRTAGRGPAVVVDLPVKVSEKVKPTEKVKSTAGRTAKPAARAGADARKDDSTELRTPAGKAKVPARRPAKSGAAATRPLPVYTAESSQPAAEPPEPTSKKSSSGRKAAKEAVLV